MEDGVPGGKGYEEGYTGYSRSYFEYDPLYYHRNYAVTKEAETKKAYLFKFSDGDTCWVPKALCKKVKNKSVYILRAFKLTPIKQ